MTTDGQKDFNPEYNGRMTFANSGPKNLALSGEEKATTEPNGGPMLRPTPCSGPIQADYDYEKELIEKETKKWREILVRLLDIVKFLVKQNLALRGHQEDIHDDERGQENKGNFLELVHLLAKYDPVIREHLVTVKLGKKIATSYLSPEIRNEFVSILAE